MLSRIIPKKTDVTGETTHFVEEIDWNQEFLQGEKWVDLFCWSVLGLSALYICILCVSTLIR